MANTFSINGTDVESLAGVRIADWSGILAGGSMSGEPWEVPGRRGAAAFDPGELRPYSFDVPVFVTGADFDAVMASVSALRALCWGTVTANRVMGSRDESAVCVVADGWGPTLVTPESARLSIPLLNMDACWYSDTPVSLSGTGTLTVPGDTPTANAEVTLGAGVTMALPGSSVTYSGTGTLVLDCLTWEASSGDVGAVSHSGAVSPLLFMPGDNAVTVTGGSGSVSVRGAWR